ncbi:Hypothetical protein R9X50_00021600 [Acrodontium crateriforme]|uniref:WD40 repeat-like protein n=1 Tax=Acrodontium crateriforme TaxID=150365 RepID=A0AAQ3LXN8_9PEZI|nr:Hypothetical protein R9X50_00021600 [Acrodontium crateriforme]
MLQNEYHRVPVTAVTFCGKSLISGEGNIMRAYDTTHGNLLNSCRIFEENQQIHGLVTSNDSALSLLAWGGSLIRAFSISQIDDLPLSFQPGSLLHSPDWILHAAVSPPVENEDAKRLVAFVTAHNGLVVLDSSELIGDHTKDLSHAPRLAELLVPGSNCILYSAQVSWLSPRHCLVAAGTAFGDVIIWSCHLTNSGENGQLEATTTVHYTFSAHEGSVFGVQISPPLEGRPRMLATCSDDRTVRIWDVSDLSISCPSLIERQRDTGFGSDVQAATDFAPPCLAKAMGHVSRIWHVRFLSSEVNAAPTSPRETLIASFGEDTAYILWSLKPQNSSGNDLPYNLEQLSSKTAHTGKHIWSVAISRTGGIATGGADGGIAIHDAPSMKSLAHQILEVPRDLLPKGASESIQKKKLEDNYRGYTFLDAYNVLCTTDFGRVLNITLPRPHEQSTEFQVREISSPIAGLHNYSVVASASGLGFISGSSGEVFLYSCLNESSLLPIARIGRKTAGLFACSIKTTISEDEVYLLVTTVGSKQAEIFKLDSKMPFNNSEQDFVKEKWSLEMPDAAFITTSFTIIELDGCCWVAIGSRNGAIAIFQIQDTKFALQIELLETNAHGNEAVTALFADTTISSTQDGQSFATAVLHSVGRDGAHAIHQLKVRGAQYEQSSINSLPELSLIHNLPLPFGPNIEGITRTANNQLWIWGFRGKSFVVYNTTTQQEVFNVVCGGAHRNWAFKPSSFLDATFEMQGGTFIWTKASKLFYQSSAPGDGYKQINSGGHGREIKTMALLEEDDLQLFATGAEDTDIKIFAYNDQASRESTNLTKDDSDVQSNRMNQQAGQQLEISTPKGFHCWQTLRKHNTGIQHLQFLTHVAEKTETGNQHTSFLLSSGGCEEFHIWTINAQKGWSKQRRDLEVGVICTSTHPRSGKSDLRITGFEAVSHHDEIEVQMAYSDSSLKTWIYDVRSQDWTLKSQGDYLAACLTGVFRSPMSTDNQNASETKLITTSTDGHITLWPYATSDAEQSHSLNWTTRIKAHQNSILASVAHTFANGSRIIITGGDDNALSFTLWTPSSTVSKTYSISRAHAAAITGLAMKPLTCYSASLVSVGLDQRVRIWDVTVNDLEVHVQRKLNVGTSVADAAQVVLCRLSAGRTGVVVAGVGMQMWSL